jgi:hypothetical protein
MPMNELNISNLVESELNKISDERAVALIRKLRVPPRCEFRPWDYGPPNTNYPCWIVVEHPASDTAIAYCEMGFGPRCPWGLLWLSKHPSMGMDSGWYTSIEDAIKDSFAWEDAKSDIP